MAWFWIASLLVLVWSLALFKLLYAPFRPSSFTFLSNGTKSEKRNVLLVVSHPDDESMFFTPTLGHLASSGYSIHILCMSTGNADGKGDTRKEEFFQACSVLKIPLQQVKILDHPAFQDGFGNIWSHGMLAKIIKEQVLMWNINFLITFDNHGISGHPNHCDVHHGTCMFLHENSERKVEAWELISTSVIRKYIGPIDIWLSIYLTRNSRRQQYCLLNNHPDRSFLAMAQHTSQWIWFRKLFIVFSRYTYVNTLQRINE